MKKRFELSNYQKYFKIVAWFYKKHLSKYTDKGVKTREALEYHHIRPLSIYGIEDNLVVAVPGRIHTKLHWLLWQHYAENGMLAEATKMEYAYKTLCTRHKMSTTDGSFIPYAQIEKQYKYLVHRFPLYSKNKENEVAKMTATEKYNLVHVKSHDCLPETFQLTDFQIFDIIASSTKQRKQQYGDNVCIDSSCSTFSAEEES